MSAFMSGEKDEMSGNHSKLKGKQFGELGKK